MANNKYQILGILALFTWLFSCKKLESYQAFGDAVTVVGRVKCLSYKDKECTLAMKLSVNADWNDGKLVPNELFSIDSTYYNDEYWHWLYNSNNGTACKIKDIQFKRSRETPAPVSLFLLIDKSAASISDQFNQDKISSFKEGFFKMIVPAKNYEVDFGICAANNLRVPALQIMSPEFKAIGDYYTGDLLPLFDQTSNGGNSNLGYALDSVINFMSKKAGNAKKVLLLMTDYLSDIPDTAVVNAIIKKALRSGIRICIYNTMDPDLPVYAQEKLCNATDGFHINDISSIFSNIEKALRTMRGILDGEEYYDVEMKLITSNSYFTNNSWGLTKTRIHFFNATYTSISFLYER